MIKTKRDIDQKDFKIVDFHFCSCESRQRNATSSGRKFQLNNLAVTGLNRQKLNSCKFANCQRKRNIGVYSTARPRAKCAMKNPCGIVRVQVRAILTLSCQPADPTSAQRRANAGLKSATLAPHAGSVLCA